MPLDPQECDADEVQSNPAMLVSALAFEPEAVEVVPVLFDYLDGFTQRDDERAYRQLVRGEESGDSLEPALEVQESLTVTDTMVTQVATDWDSLRATVAFRAVADSPMGIGSDCAYWVVDVDFIRGGEHGWLIDRSQGRLEDEQWKGC